MSPDTFSFDIDATQATTLVDGTTLPSVVLRVKKNGVALRDFQFGVTLLDASDPHVYLRRVETDGATVTVIKESVGVSL